MKLASLILCLAAGLAQAAETPADYPQQVPLRLQGEGPWYRLQVPMSVQLAAAHADLRDLRVFDKEGEALPYALSAAAAQGSSTAHEAAARLMRAIETVTAEGEAMPRDLGGTATTEQVTQAVCRAL